jgi:hypothetical protein
MSQNFSVKFEFFHAYKNDIISIKLQIVWAFHIGAHIMYMGSGKNRKNFETCPFSLDEFFSFLFFFFEFFGGKNMGVISYFIFGAIFVFVGVFLNFLRAILILSYMIKIFLTLPQKTNQSAYYNSSKTCLYFHYKI